jgi:hypothetical protein
MNVRIVYVDENRNTSALAVTMVTTLPMILRAFPTWIPEILSLEIPEAMLEGFGSKTK